MYSYKMLTQQQRNNRRQRASPTQLKCLQKAFRENPRPDQYMRDNIAKKIDMTPRSVQIWFQNNRAKLRSAIKHGTHYPRSMAFLSDEDRDICRAEDEFPDTLFLDYDLGQGSSVDIKCTSLVIGSWQRHSCGTSDQELQVSLCEATRLLWYVVYHNHSFYRLLVPFTAVVDASITPDEKDARTGHLNLTVTPDRLRFEVRAESYNWWERCSDFTNEEASESWDHRIGGAILDVQAAFISLRCTNTVERPLLEQTSAAIPEEASVEIEPHTRESLFDNSSFGQVDHGACHTTNQMEIDKADDEDAMALADCTAGTTWGNFSGIPFHTHTPPPSSSSLDNPLLLGTEKQWAYVQHVTDVGRVNPDGVSKVYDPGNYIDYTLSTTSPIEPLFDDFDFAEYNAMEAE